MLPSKPTYGDESIPGYQWRLQPVQLTSLHSQGQNSATVLSAHQEEKMPNFTQNNVDQQIRFNALQASNHDTGFLQMKSIPQEVGEWKYSASTSGIQDKMIQRQPVSMTPPYNYNYRHTQSFQENHQSQQESRGSIDTDDTLRNIPAEASARIAHIESETSERKKSDANKGHLKNIFHRYMLSYLDENDLSQSAKALSQEIFINMDEQIPLDTNVDASGDVLFELFCAWWKAVQQQHQQPLVATSTPKKSRSSINNGCNHRKVRSSSTNKHGTSVNSLRGDVANFKPLQHIASSEQVFASPSSEARLFTPPLTSDTHRQDLRYTGFSSPLQQDPAGEKHAYLEGLNGIYSPFDDRTSIKNQEALQHVLQPQNLLPSVAPSGSPTTVKRNSCHIRPASQGKRKLSTSMARSVTDIGNLPRPTTVSATARNSSPRGMFRSSSQAARQWQLDPQPMQVSPSNALSGASTQTPQSEEHPIAPFPSQQHNFSYGFLDSNNFHHSFLKDSPQDITPQFGEAFPSPFLHNNNV